MTTKPNTITEKQASYIEALMVKSLGHDMPDAPMFRKGLATLSRAAASRMISDLKAAPQMTAMERRQHEQDHFRAERKAAASEIHVHLDYDGGWQTITVEDGWTPNTSYRGQAVPGHSCPDGCCGLMVDGTTWDAEERTVEGCIC